MYKKKSLGNFTLLALEKAVDHLVKFDDFINNPRRYAYGSGWDYPLKKSAISRVLRRLRENGLIDFVDDEQLVIRLTDKGREKALLARMWVDDKKWDGKWRIIIFDIPEKRRVVRDVLRSKLKSWDFIHLQKSVWASQKDCTDELRNFIQKVGIKDWVMVFESDNVDF